MAKKETNNDIVVTDKKVIKNENKIPKEKKAKKTTVKEVEKVEEVNSKPIKVVDVDEAIDDVKFEKKKRFFDEVKSFFILVIIIGLVILGGYLFIKYAEPIEWKNKDKNPVISETKNVEVTSYTTELENGTLRVINNKYLVEYDADAIYKIMDLDLNVLYEGNEEDKYYLIEGVNNQLYAYSITEVENSAVINLYILENEKLVEVKEFAKTGVYYVPLIDDNYLIGIVGNDCYLNDVLEDVCSTEIFTLDEKEDVLEEYSVIGDLNLGTSNTTPIYTRNANYVSIFNTKNEKYGLYDLANHKIIIKSNYEQLYTTYGDAFVVAKDDRMGIIDKKLKKLVPFEYDFIDINSSHYVLSKNNKLALMDNEYNLINDFDIDYVNYSDVSINNGYVYRDSLFRTNSFTSFKIDDGYVLGNKITGQDGYGYLSNELIYVKDKEKIKVLKNKEYFGYEDILYSYSFKDGKLVIYNSDLEVKYSIDLSSYDYEDYPSVILVNGNTIMVTLDSELYFDFESGQEIDGILDVTYNIGDLVIQYTNEDNTVKVYEGDKVIAKYDYNPLVYKKPYNMIDEDSFYYMDDENYVKIGKR